MAESCLLSAPSSLFYNKTKHLFFSAPSRPLKLQLSSLNPSPSLSLAATTHHRSSAPLFVAQTSDWAQQEEDNTLTLEDQEEGAEGVSETEAGWEPNGEDAEIEGAEEGEGEEGDYEEPPEEAKLFVGNLPYDADGHKLAELFNQVGTVDLAEVKLFSFLSLFGWNGFVFLCWSEIMYGVFGFRLFITGKLTRAVALDLSPWKRLKMLRKLWIS